MKAPLFLLAFFLACQPVQPKQSKQPRQLQHKQEVSQLIEEKRKEVQPKYKPNEQLSANSESQLEQHYQSNVSANYQNETNNDRETFEPDENWDYYEIRNWFLFQHANIAIRKNIGLDSIVENDKIYLSLSCEFRALKEKVQIAPYHDFWLAGQGGLSDVAYPGVQASSRAYKEWAQMWVGDFEGPQVYERLNNLPRGRAARDVIEVGSSRNATIGRKLPFPVAEILTTGYSIEEEADICHFVPIIKGLFYLGHRFNRDSIQIVVKDWQPYQFLRPRGKSESEGKTTEE